MDNNKDTDTDTDLELALELEYFCKIYIWRYSPHSVIWITSSKLERKFRWG
jgi:hypothetical protein